VMSVMSDGPRTVPAIARRLGLSRQGVQRVANDLRAEGLVELRTNPDHARSPLVALTPTGADTVTQLFADSDQMRAELLVAAGVTVDELAAARRTLRRILDAFGERSAAGPVRG
jgi:DNA-binding MarR family transcriptional regulator